jgi:hypothetical protein
MIGIAVIVSELFFSFKKIMIAIDAI